MNNKIANKRLIPRRAIIVYADRIDGYEGNQNYYLESREIKNVAGKYSMMAPVPLGNNVIKDIAMTFLKSNSVKMDMSGFIPEHILYGTNTPGRTVVMWYRPGMKRSLNFSSHLGIKGDSFIYTPACLYLVINRNLYIFGLMSNERPTLSTKLYNAPYFNIYSDGRVCLGTADVGKVKARTFQKEAERFESAFYRAEQNGGNTDRVCKLPLTKLWSTLIKKPVPFPSKNQLVPHSKFKTMGQLVDKLIGGAADGND